MLKKLYNFLKSIKNIIVFIRFAAPWRPDTFFFQEFSLKYQKLLILKSSILEKQNQMNLIQKI